MLVFFTQVTALFPVLPVYLIQRWGEDAPVGLVVGAMAAGLLCFRPLIGILIDHWGRKPVLWMGLIVMLSILPLYWLSPTPEWLMGVRVLHGISQAALATASQTMLVDLVPPHRRTAMLGYLAMSNTIGFSLGPFISSYLFTAGGFTLVILSLVGLTALGFAISLPLPWLKPPKPKLTKSMQLPEGASGRTLTETQTIFDQSTAFPWKCILSFPVRNATLIFFITSFLHGGVVTFLPLFIDNSAEFFSLQALMAVLVRFSLGRWGDFLSRRWIVSIGMLCSGSALIGFAWLPDQLILWSIIYGLGFGAMFPILSAVVSLAAPTAQRGRVYSFFLAGFDSGMTLGGAGVQPLTAFLSLASLFSLLGGIGCVFSLLAFWQFSRNLP